MAGRYVKQTWTKAHAGVSYLLWIPAIVSFGNLGLAEPENYNETIASKPNSTKLQVLNWFVQVWRN